MKERKSLDRLFQEKFKDFEADPDEQVWKNIEAALKGKKKRRVIPIWFRFAGAAVLLLGLFTFNQVFNGSVAPGKPPAQNAPAIGNGVASGEGISPARTVSPQSPSPTQTGNGIANGDNKGAVEAVAPQSVSTGQHVNRGIAVEEKKSGKTKGSHKAVTITNDTQVVSSETGVTGSSKKHNKANNIKGNSFREESAVAGISKGGKRKGAVHKSNASEQANTAIAKEESSNNGKRKIKGNKTTLHNANATSGLAVNSGRHKKKAGNKETNTGQEQATPVAVQDQGNKAQPNAATAPQIQPGNNDIIKDVPLKTNDIATAETKKDSVKPPNELEELLKKQQEKEEKTAVTKVDRWQVSTSVTPVYFSSASGGSPIDKQFEGNSKSYETNMSYGVGVNYAVNKRISVRAGINKFTVGYNTKDVLFYAGLESQNLGNITPSSTGSFIQVVNQSTAGSNLLPFEVAIKDNNNVGFINQQMGYIEVPMELSYKILDSKFSVSVIGGLSTLFLDENAVSIHSGALTAKMGEANNLNDVHFSSNFGLGFRYRFMKSFELHCEPTFKYQINTFRNDAGNFKPYLIGVYSGLSFSF